MEDENDENCPTGFAKEKAGSPLFGLPFKETRKNVDEEIHATQLGKCQMLERNEHTIWLFF